MANPRPTDHAAEFEKLTTPLAYKHEAWRVFSDFAEMAALAHAQAFDKTPEREEQYMRIIGRYEPPEVEIFPKLLGLTVMALEDQPRDFLGSVFMNLGLANHYAGQFFTPYEVSSMMAEILVGDDLERIIAEHGFVSASEPACGAGGMVIALAQAMKRRGINYQESLHVTAVDIAPVCVHMTMIQLSLMGIPAYVVRGDTLRLEEHTTWRTPMHYLGFWEYRLRRRWADAEGPPIAAPAPEPTPTPALAEPAPPAVSQQLELF